MGNTKREENTVSGWGGNHAHIQIEFFIYKASHFPGFSLNRGGEEGARQLSDVQRDRV